MDPRLVLHYARLTGLIGAGEAARLCGMSAQAWHASKTKPAPQTRDPYALWDVAAVRAYAEHRRKQIALRQRPDI